MQRNLISNCKKPNELTCSRTKMKPTIGWLNCFVRTSLIDNQHHVWQWNFGESNGKRLALIEIRNDLNSYKEFFIQELANGFSEKDPIVSLHRFVISCPENLQILQLDLVLVFLITEEAHKNLLHTILVLQIDLLTARQKIYLAIIFTKTFWL